MLVLVVIFGSFLSHFCVHFSGHFWVIFLPFLGQSSNEFNPLNMTLNLTRAQLEMNDRLRQPARDGVGVLTRVANQCVPERQSEEPALL